MDEEAEAVVGFASGLAGAGEETSFCGFVNRIVSAVMREEIVIWDDFWVIGF